MKKLFTLLLLIGFSFSYSQTPFCDGFEKGYQKGLDSCLKVGVTSDCPIPEIGADSYNDGYGMGYAQARQKCSSSKQTATSTGTFGKADRTLVTGAKNAYSGSVPKINKSPNYASKAPSNGNNTYVKPVNKPKQKEASIKIEIPLKVDPTEYTHLALIDASLIMLAGNKMSEKGSYKRLAEAFANSPLRVINPLEYDKKKFKKDITLNLINLIMLRLISCVVNLSLSLIKE